MSRLRKMNRTSLFALLLVILAIIISIVGYWLVHGQLNVIQIISDFYSHISSTLVGVAITVVMIDRLNQIREERIQAENNKQHQEAKRKQEQIKAINELKYTESPEGRQLILDRMRDGDLFRGALLYRVNLEEARLHFANLRGANLSSVNLTRADMWNADLRGADLRDANLTKTSLDGVTLPDGTQWRNYVHMESFTDESHPDFEDTLKRIDMMRKQMIDI